MGKPFLKRHKENRSPIINRPQDDWTVRKRVGIDVYSLCGNLGNVLVRSSLKPITAFRPV